MHYLLVFGASLLFLFMAPLKTSMTGALFASYVAGFSVALDTTFGASILIATISTAASVLTLWAATGLL